MANKPSQGGFKKVFSYAVYPVATDVPLNVR